MRKMVVLMLLFAFSSAFGLLIEDFESGVPFRWYNNGAPDMGISEFAIDDFSLRVNNSDDFFYVTFYDPSPTIIGESDLRFKFFHSPSEIGGEMSAYCFMLYDDEYSESRTVTPGSWTFDEWNEMSCNGGGDGKLVSVIVYFTNTKGTIYFDDFGFTDEDQGGGLTGAAVFQNNTMAVFFPALIIGLLGVLVLELFSRR